MGHKEFSVGVFSFKEGTSLIKFPTMEDAREAFLLYHMNMIPMVITHMPNNIKEAKKVWEIMKMGSPHQYSQECYQIFP